ncbi:PREDICTED: protein IQ-DOMAIN 14-like [Nicotiana attenuata]|uniref:DUF4005 domain-containing protein n=1 Tax=Nicotiana attenuata TaxID=49451 RepID=A0A1J6KLR7_NICAT|nr:PREDICTED: protein IQ-DOMAIN 14-like [Nicotiana attenuata]OIT22695.1 hypothetical protein A4A49_30059 [Nicotiana attenuata]
MGKSLNCFKGLLGLKKRPDHSPSSSPLSGNTNPYPTQTIKPTKKKWSFIKSYRSEKDYYQHHYDHQPLNAAHISYHGTLPTSFHGGHDVGLDPTKHAIAIAEATAVAAEAAIAAAQAAAAVAKLTTSGRFMTTTSSMTCVSRTGAASRNREEWAAILIQSHFRAYLARRALRALKGLAKLQAVVRGHIVRKQTADTLRRTRALVNLDPATPEKLEHAVRHRNMKHVETFMLKKQAPKSNIKATGTEEVYMIHTDCSRIDARSRKHGGSTAKTTSIDDDKSDKIVKIDIEKPYVNPRNFFQSSHINLKSEQYSYSLPASKDATARQTVTTPSSCGSQSLSLLKLNQDADEEASFCTADNNPKFSSASSQCGSSRRRLFTTTKSNASRNCSNGYQGHPNYMSYTESAKAKLRSMSEPKQRPRYERSSTMKRYSVNVDSESRKVSAFHPNFTNKAYPSSVRDRSAFSGGLLHRY